MINFDLSREKLKNIVVLGDCQSDGNNCLAHEILEDENVVTSWSLRYYQKFPETLKWMIKNNKNNGLHQKIPISNLEHTVWEYLRKSEQKIAWPELISDYNFTNLSIRGSHFYGYHRRLKNWIKNNYKPDLVILTDYTFSHTVVSFKLNGITHVIEKSLDYNDQQWNKNLYNESVHQNILSKLKLQKDKPRVWHERRHKHSYYFLTKFLKFYNIPYITMCFGDMETENEDFFKNLMGCDIDCTEIHRLYRAIGERGEHSKIKLINQKAIADKVKYYLDNIYSNQ